MEDPLKPSRKGLAPESAFVVHLAGVGSVRGRVEHVTSGRSLCFDSAAEPMKLHAADDRGRRFDRRHKGARMISVSPAVRSDPRPGPRHASRGVRASCHDRPLPARQTVSPEPIRGWPSTPGRSPSSKRQSTPPARAPASMAVRRRQRRDYGRCVSPLIKAAVKAGALRSKCKGRMTKAHTLSTCGVAEPSAAVPCIQTSTSGRRNLPGEERRGMRRQAGPLLACRLSRLPQLRGRCRYATATTWWTPATPGPATCAEPHAHPTTD